MNPLMGVMTIVVETPGLAAITSCGTVDVLTEKSTDNDTVADAAFVGSTLLVAITVTVLP